MTDYIELILGEQEEREEETAAAGLTGAIRRRRAGARRAAGAEDGAGIAAETAAEMAAEAASGAAAETAAGSGPRRTGDADRLPVRPAGAKRLEEWTPRTGAGTGAAVLAARLRQAEAAAGYRAGGFTAPALTGQAAARAAGAPELDALFQRDARRYDGGFTLF